MANHGCLGLFGRIDIVDKQSIFRPLNFVGIGLFCIPYQEAFFSLRSQLVLGALVAALPRLRLVYQRCY